jgi:hydrogenase maturation protein HypF
MVPVVQDERVRLRVQVRGAVQGVGFRPFVFRLAGEMGLCGWVNNTSGGVWIEVEGAPEELEEFLLRLEREKPPRAIIQGLEPVFLDPVGYAAFEIRHSEGTGEKTALVLPDIATCQDCLGEIFDPTNRRFRYPFTNCTHCGPRYSIIEALPYDRQRTTMKHFAMCAACQQEYEDPRDRRFHAQPNACPECGPQLALWDQEGRALAQGDEALFETAAAIRAGQVVAVKGLGGFHLMVDACYGAAVQRLRQAKDREEKPFALMYPSLERVEEDCLVEPLEERLLCAAEAPIVLLRRNSTRSQLARGVAPGNPCLGVMLPYAPLHHLLLAELGFPVVATSGNLKDEPICTDEKEALQRLGGIADLFLVHDRPIKRHVDDSVVRLVLGRELVLRRARGYAPLPVHLEQPAPVVVGVGAHLKNAVAFAARKEVFLSQHIGDLETGEAFAAFQGAIEDFEKLYEVRPEAVVCDSHPDYLSTRWAQSCGLPVLQVQHHHAHVLSCMAENSLEGRVLGVSWDGTGYGDDGTVWGGEFLRVADQGYLRLAHLRPFPLPGGDKAMRQPRRCALGLLYELWGEALFARQDLPPLRAFAEGEIQIVRRMLANGLNAPLTSSAGRLFDAVASIAGLRQVSHFEGQAAMELEWAAAEGVEASYEFILENGIADWGPAVEEMLEDLEGNMPLGVVASRFHNGLAEVIVQVALEAGEERVVLSGGCFQNRCLTERAVARLRAAGLKPYWHQRVPPNDGGIALGQVAAAWRLLQKEQVHVPGRAR